MMGPPPPELSLEESLRYAIRTLEAAAGTLEESASFAYPEIWHKFHGPLVLVQTAINSIRRVCEADAAAQAREQADAKAMTPTGKAKTSARRAKSIKKTAPKHGPGEHPGDP